MLEKLKNNFKSKALGFYFTAAVVVLSFLQLIVYIAAFTPVSWESYMHGRSYSFRYWQSYRVQGYPF